MRESLINISNAMNGRCRRHTLTCAITAERQGANSPGSQEKRIRRCRISPTCFTLVFMFIKQCWIVKKSILLWKWHTAKYGDPYSEFMLCIYPSKCTHTAVNTHTHREHTPGAVFSHLCCGARGAAVGSVPCSRAPRRVLKVERALFIHSPHLQPLPDLRLELTTFLLWVRLSKH